RARFPPRDRHPIDRTRASLFPCFATLAFSFCREVVSNKCLKINRPFEIGGDRANKICFSVQVRCQVHRGRGGGLASALCAYFFGQIERPPPPPATVVQMAPVNAEHARMARNDESLLGESARTETESQPESVGATPATGSAPKLAKPVQAAPPRRNQRSEQGPLAETKARWGEPLAISPSRVASNSAPKTAGPSVQAPVGYGGSVAVNSGEDERPLLARLKQIPSWFLPENDRIF